VVVLSALSVLFAYAKLEGSTDHLQLTSFGDKRIEESGDYVIRRPFIQLEDGCEVISSNATHLCLNHDFYTCHNTSVWTMATSGEAYLLGAVVLGASVRKHTVKSAPVDMVIMELVSKPLGEAAWKRLNHVGWKRCQVQPIEPLHNPGMERFADQFSKLRLWGMTTYERIIYMDSDTLVVGSIDPLSRLRLEDGKQIGATEDFYKQRFTGTFNMGVFVIHPQLSEYNRLIDLQSSDAVVYKHSQCEQGFLVEVYKRKWQDIGFHNNANLVVYGRKREHWDKYAKQLAILHYTIEKPWACSVQYLEVCKVWQRMHRELEESTPCQNVDYSPQHKIAVVTMNTGPGKEMNLYLNATLNLGLSVRRHSSVSADLVLMELLSNPIPSDAWTLLRDVGWKRCVVSKLSPPRAPNRRFVDQFTKLHMWAMASYTSVLYMDSDSFVISSIDDLLKMDLQGHKIGATQDFGQGKWRSAFNMGVCKLIPNRSEYERLMTLQENDSIDYQASMCEQGWLNVVYKDQWKDIGFHHGANMAALDSVNITISDVKVVHFTIPKPWECQGPKHHHAQKFCTQWQDSIEKYRVKSRINSAY
jgi:lipopolysaccharide biosynthesis glycosyltransferase